LRSRAQFVLQDYRDVRGEFDRIVSVGMFEHVGRAHYGEYFRTIAQRLTLDGVALIHTVGRTDGPAPTSAWTKKYIFPGGYIPSLSEILPAVEAAGLIIADLEVLRMHYAETLRCWRERFSAKRAEIAEMYDERFCRMWEYYLATSEASFRFGSNVVFQLQLAKCQEAVPVTRAYVEAAPQAAQAA
jgi:cyclopropane-fatty-acyl-phospholipid synthase